MTSYPDSLEDDEKHFLGNLLDDETSFSSSPQSPRATTQIPTTSVIDGPIISNISGNDGPSRFWPEPPPPYTPAKSPSLWGGDHSAENGSILFDGILSSTGLKEPSTWESLLNFSASSSNFSTNPVQKPTEIHHHHQHTHQHTHVLQVINKHHYGSPLDSPHYAETPQPFASVVRKAAEESSEVKRPSHLPPHSAPVVHKMPFSYRDVAARKEVSNGLSPTQNNKRVPALGESEPKLEPARSTESIADASKNKDSKQKAEAEFQKISRKKAAKEKKVSPVSETPPQLKAMEVLPQPKVNVPTRYQVLENLHPASPKIIKTDSVDSDDLIFIPKAEKIEQIDDLDISPPRIKKIIAPEIKKKSAPKKRNSRKKNDSDNWLLRLFWNYLIILVEGVQDSLKWLMVLVVDVCQRSGELFYFFLHSIYESFLEFLRGIWQYLLGCFLSVFFACRQMSLRQMLFTSQPDAIWGLDENMALPTTTEEALERLLRVRRVDAYSILGLRADCTEDDIHRHHGRLRSLLNVERCPLEGMEEAENLIDTAFNLIAGPETRSLYNLNNLNKISMHNELLEMWDTLRMKIEESRHTMLCDCGKRHARIPTAIKMTEARYCRRCGQKHAARPNDLWVETRLLGLAWIYYTCADGVVYDITEWATCETNLLKHMRPNAHVVQYRLVSPGTPVDKNTQSLQEYFEEPWPNSAQKSNRAQVSYRPMEPRDEDKSRRAANRRQKRR